MNLYNYEVRDIDTMLHFIYSGCKSSLPISFDPTHTNPPPPALDDTQYNPKGHHATFEKYARLFTIASDFQLPHLTTDAKTLLGQFCDRHLLTLCTYDPTTSGRTGVLAPSPAHPPFLSDLLSAIHLAFPPTPTTPATPLQLLLASFCYGGRTRLFTYPAFRALADTHPSFGNTIFRLMLPGTACEWAPAPVCDTAAGVDHTHRSQHPDRCAHCDRTFGDSALRKKAMFNPFEANVRAATYCAACVKGNEKGEKPLWRMEGGATTH